MIGKILLMTVLVISLAACSVPLSKNWHEKNCTKTSACWQKLTPQQQKQLERHWQKKQTEMDVDKQKLKTFQKNK